MSKTYRPWKIDQPLLLPVTVKDFVGDDHLARFVVELVVEHLDLSEIEAVYASVRGQPPYDPAMMTALLLYAYCSGVYSSRRIAKASRERVDFMSLVGLDAPDLVGLVGQRWTMAIIAGLRHKVSMTALGGSEDPAADNAGHAETSKAGQTAVKCFAPICKISASKVVKIYK